MAATICDSVNLDFFIITGLKLIVLTSPRFREGYNTTVEGYESELLLGQNAMVFGYGDETNSDYKKIEDSEIDEYFLNIKSFYYSLNRNYKELIEFLYESDFEVFSIGHSLGVSDRTMLKTIFEHNHCKKIHLFHREFDKGDDQYNLSMSMESYFKNVIRLSRHFEQNAMMRYRLQPYNRDLIIPQFIKSKDKSI